MTVSNNALKTITAYKQYSEMLDMPSAQRSVVKDDYPTRLAAAPASLTQARRDAVVKGRNLSGPLSSAQLDEFERKGFLFIPNLISGEELEALRDEMTLLMNNQAYRDQEFSITEPESHDIRSLFAVHRLSKRLAQLACDERLAGLPGRLLVMTLTCISHGLTINQALQVKGLIGTRISRRGTRKTACRICMLLAHH